MPSFQPKTMTIYTENNDKPVTISRLITLHKTGTTFRIDRQRTELFNPEIKTPVTVGLYTVTCTRPHQITRTKSGKTLVLDTCTDIFEAIEKAIKLN